MSVFSMCDELTIDPEFAGLCPDLTPEEADLLEASLTSEGCRERIIVWANHSDTIIDGHNRYRICRRFRVPYKTKAVVFTSREEVTNWIISNQLGRRNLTESQRSYLRGKRYQAEKKREGGSGSNQYTKELDQNDPVPTADRLATELHVSAPTIKRDAAFAKAVDKIEQTAGPEAKQKILSGQCGLGKAAIIEAAELPKKKMERAIESGSLPVQTKVVANAMRYADMAICQLERITDDDPECRAALDKVWNWLKSRRSWRKVQQDC